MRERILVFGGAGSGKSYAWMKLAKKFTSSNFYVIDTEIGASRSLEEFPDVVSRVSIFPVVDWTEYKDALKVIQSKCTANDWVVVDMMDKTWSAVQRYFIAQIFDQEMGEYFLEARKKMKKDSKSLFGGRDSALKGWTDWATINRLYQDFALPLIYRFPANLFMTSSAQSVSEEDGKEVRELYGPYGIKPVGQKDLAHQPDTVLMLAHTREGYYMTTIKDRGGRKYVDKQPLVDFGLQYGHIAKWK